MTGIEIEVEGAKELQQDLKALGDSLDDVPMTKISDRYVQITQSLAPVDTGRLRASIRPSNKDNQAGAEATAPYARFPNYGTKYIRPQNFMGRADAILAAENLALIEQGVDDLIEKRGLSE